MTTTPTVDDRHSALALPDLWDAVDTAFASRHLHDVCVTGTVIKLAPGRWYTYGELAAFGDDGQAAASLGFSIHHTLMASIRNELSTTGAAAVGGSSSSSEPPPKQPAITTATAAATALSTKYRARDFSIPMICPPKARRPICRIGL